MTKSPVGAERRRAKRTLIQESFSMFVVIPDVHGMARIYMRDVSKLGLCFRSEVDTELKADETVMLHLYVNPLFFLPFRARVVRISGGEVAVEFTDTGAKSVRALGLLLDFFDAAAEAGQTS